ncbi:transposase, partial [Nocardia nova]|nr:transposase [Nocardia nova]
MTDPAGLAPDPQRQLDAILTASPELTALADHVRSFADMMRHLRGSELEAWMKAVDADDHPALHSFVRGLRRDQDAATAGLTMEWNSGAAEGHVNRIILWNLKCQVCATQPCVTATIGSWVAVSERSPSR